MDIEDHRRRAEVKRRRIGCAILLAVLLVPACWWVYIHLKHASRVARRSEVSEALDALDGQLRDRAETPTTYSGEGDYFGGIPGHIRWRVERIDHEPASPEETEVSTAARLRVALPEQPFSGEIRIEYDGPEGGRIAELLDARLSEALSSYSVTREPATLPEESGWHLRHLGADSSDDSDRAGANEDRGGS